MGRYKNRQSHAHHVTRAVVGYVHTLGAMLQRQHELACPLTPEHLLAIFWPPTERDAVRTVMTRWRCDPALARPVGLSAHLPLDTDKAAALVGMGLVIKHKETPPLHAGVSEKPLDDLDWASDPDTAAALTVYREWATPLIQDLREARRACNLLARMGSANASLIEMRMWTPFMPVLVAAVDGVRFAFAECCPGGFTPAASGAPEDITIASNEIAAELEAFREVRNPTWAPTPTQRAWLGGMGPFLTRAMALHQALKDAPAQPAPTVRVHSADFKLD